MLAHTTASHATPQGMHDARAPLARRRLVTHRYARLPAVASPARFGKTAAVAAAAVAAAAAAAAAAAIAVAAVAAAAAAARPRKRWCGNTRERPTGPAAAALTRTVSHNPTCGHGTARPWPGRDRSLRRCPLTALLILLC